MDQIGLGFDLGLPVAERLGLGQSLAWDPALEGFAGYGSVKSITKLKFVAGVGTSVAYLGMFLDGYVLATSKDSEQKFNAGMGLLVGAASMKIGGPIGIILGAQHVLCMALGGYGKCTVPAVVNVAEPDEPAVWVETWHPF